MKKQYGSEKRTDANIFSGNSKSTTTNRFNSTRKQQSNPIEPM